MSNLHYARDFFNPYLLGEVCLHDDANVKLALNIVCVKNKWCLNTYAQALKDFAHFLEN
jgi:hypothetical protein